MSWFRRLFPKWRVTEANIQREISKIFKQGPLPFLEVEERVLQVCAKFGIRHGAIFLAWSSQKHLRPQYFPRQCGEIVCTVRIVTFNKRDSKEQVLSFHAKHVWFARVKESVMLCAKYKFVEGCHFVGTPIDDGWERMAIKSDAPDMFQTSLEDVLHEQVSYED